jgi:hypothetical protein
MFQSICQLLPLHALLARLTPIANRVKSVRSATYTYLHTTLMKQTRHDQSGFSHIIIPLVIVVGIAIYGVYRLVGSHADSPVVAPISDNAVLAADAQSCAHPHGPFSVSGNHVLDGTGKVFNAYGITVYGLSESNWQQNLSDDETQINDIANDWCTNTVRIQIAPYNLLTNVPAGQPYNAAFMTAINDEVSLALHDNMNVVITAQTENLGGSPGPTAETVAYWNVLSNYYKGVGNIIFDLFNEPRVKVADSANPANSGADTWKLWQDGGVYDGTTYVGMQTLVTDLRQAGISRTFWVEGPYSASTLAQVSSYPITGGDVIYDIHHPGGPATTAQWDADFGTLAATQPVVVGEWTQFTGGFCWSNAATSIPNFFNYLTAKQIGLVTWTLKPGILIQGTNLNLPTNIDSDFTCGSTQDEGAGRLVANYFKAQNSN